MALNVQAGHDVWYVMCYLCIVDVRLSGKSRGLYITCSRCAIGKMFVCWVAASLTTHNGECRVDNQAVDVTGDVFNNQNDVDDKSS